MEISPHQFRILIVDDDEALLEELKPALQDEGYGVVVASSGNMALHMLESGHIDLVLSDIRMPDGDGKYLLQAVRRDDPKIPFLLMSGFSDVTSGDALQSGANGFYEKPLNARELFSAIESELRQAYTP